MTGVKVLGLNIDDVPPDQLLDRLMTGLSDERHRVLSTINTEILLWAQRDPRCRSALELADWRICDAVGVQWAAAYQQHDWPVVVKLLLMPFSLLRLLFQPASAGRVLKHRYVGRQLFLDLLERAGDKQRSVYFLGGGPGVAEHVATKAQSDHPGLKVMGWHEGNAREPTEILTQLQPSDILFVAFSHPWQEYFVAEQLPNLPAKLVIGVGGTFDYYIGAKPMGSRYRQLLPPAWVGRWGLEWAWRLVTQPNRFARIMQAVWLFAYKVATAPTQK